MWLKKQIEKADERIEKKSGIYVYIMAYYFALKKEILPLSTTEMDLKSIMLSEISQSIETGLTSRVSESAIWLENEKQDTRVQWKARIRGLIPLQGEGAETESRPALLYSQPWKKECGGS